MKSGLLRAAGAALVIALCAGSAQASISVAGYSFADDAFVDSLIASSGSYFTNGGSVSDVLTDKDVNTYALTYSTDAFVDLGFVDNLAVNGAGADIVLFELGGFIDGWNVTINGITKTYPSAYTGFAGTTYQINSAEVDLSDFGIAAGAGISLIHLAFEPSPSGETSTSLVGALNSISVGGAVPEPASWAMMIGGLGFVGAAMRRRKTVVAFA